MSADNAVPVKCKKCGHTFTPETKGRLPWTCPSCKANNPNLKRLYRSFADLCILGLIATGVIAAFAIKHNGITVGVVLSAVHGVLLLVTIVVVYRSSAPWVDTTVKGLIWAVLGLACVFNVIIPLVFRGLILIPFVVIYALVFGYLVWLGFQTRRCTVRPNGPEA